MGEVYLASDTELGRKVALKVLPQDAVNDPERIRRFNQEARAVSRLNHPNILTIYEGIQQFQGTHFIVSEYIKGENLRQRQSRGALDLCETLDITIQVSTALHIAHKAGVVHRDIKPENIMIREDDIVKVLDFGLAKLMISNPGSTDSNAPTLFQTDPGILLGTVAYMSPEQARGQAIDARSDVWSLGICLYEMATGQLPFIRETKVDTITAILKDDFPPIDESQPAELVRILRKALRKDKNERYQTMQEYVLDLKTLKHDIESKDIKTKRKKTAPHNLPANFRLLMIVGGLSVFLIGLIAFGFWFRQQAKNREEARTHYSTGRVLYGKRNKESLIKAKEQFELAISKDSNYALAYVGLADYFVVEEEYLGTPSAENIPKAEQYIDKALALDEKLGEAYATRGFIRAKQWNWAEAGDFYTKAIENNRNYATGRQWYSWYLRNIGEYEQSRDQIELAYQLAYHDDDLLPIIHANVVIAYILKEDYPRAIEEGNKLVARYPDFWQGYSWLGKAYQEQGNKTEALKNLNEAVRISKRSHTILANLGYAYARYGDTQEANKILNELIGLYNNKKATGQSVAKIYNGLSNKEKAFEWLNKDVKARSGELPNISWHPAFKSLHGDPRFTAILAFLKLPPH
jgi:serine/threonine protein kinase